MQKEFRYFSEATQWLSEEEDFDIDRVVSVNLTWLKSRLRWIVTVVTD